MVKAVAAHTLYLSLNSDAVDVSPGTKRDAVSTILGDYRTSVALTAAIGDSANDLPFLTFPGLGAVGAPANAQPRVLGNLAELANRVPLQREAPAGFLDFYDWCAEAKLHLVIADRDGVIRGERIGEGAERIRTIFSHMGSAEHPFLVILTGSSYEQNLSFIEEYGLRDALAENAAARDRHHIYAENGSVRINAYRRTCDVVTTYDAELLRLLRTEISAEVAADLEPLLESYGFSLSRSPSSDPGVVYMPEKMTMLTVNVPRLDARGAPFRAEPSSSRFRACVADIMRSVLKAHLIEVHEL